MSNPTLTRAEVVEKAAEAILKLEEWRLKAENRRVAANVRRKGESRPKRPFASADAIIEEYTTDSLEQCRMLREAYQRAGELREP